MKVAVLGYGHLGKWHCDKAFSLQKENFYALVEKFPEAQKQAREKFPHLKIVGDLKEILQEIDAAIVVTPTSTHCELVCELLKNNKHVFCEKPLGTTTNELKKIQEFLRPGIVLQIGHIERYQNVWSNWKKYFDHPSPFSIRLNRTGVFKGRALDVPVTTDLMIHDLDLLLWLKRERPNEIKVTSHQLRSNHPDEVQASFNYADGSEAIIINSRNSTKERRDIEITDDRGTLYIDLLNQTVSEANKKFVSPDFVKVHPFLKVDQLLEEQKHFYDCIQNHKQPLVGFHEAMEAQVYLDKVHEAIQTGKRIKC